MTIETNLAKLSTDLNDALCALPSGHILTGDGLRALHSHAKACGARLREIVAAIEAAAIEHIQATGNDIELEDGKRWYVATKKKVTARDDSDVLRAVLWATGGDVARLTTGADGVLASSPWKQGTIKSIVGAEKFEALFATTYETDLATGAAVRILKIADPAFAIVKAKAVET